MVFVGELVGVFVKVGVTLGVTVGVGVGGFTPSDKTAFAIPLSTNVPRFNTIDIQINHF